MSVWGDTPTMRAWAFAAALVVTSIGATARVQHADDLARYRQLIDAYRHGERIADGDVDRVLGAEGAYLVPETTHLVAESTHLAADSTRPVARASESGSTWTADELTAAAMLHTDACLRLVKSRRRVGTDSAAPSGAVAGAHLEAAATLLGGAIERDGLTRDYAIRWRETVSGLLHAFEAPDLEANLRARADDWSRLSKDGSDARAAYARGLLAEIRAAVAGRLSGPLLPRAMPISPDAFGSLRSAYDEYAGALRLDPTFLDAAVHLGRVALLQRHDGEAVLHLQRASKARSASIRYLAEMLLGAAAERGGRLDEALDHYHHAVETHRWGQSAPLALSHALMRAGRDDEARAALMAHFDVRDNRVFDPLWTYLANPDTDLGPMLDELRAEVWR